MAAICVALSEANPIVSWNERTPLFTEAEVTETTGVELDVRPAFQTAMSESYEVRIESNHRIHEVN